jgi:hypothetical protein
VSPPEPPFGTPTLNRIDRFTRRRPDIPVSPWYDNPSRKWESTEPGQEPRQWASATAMIDHLEAAYPDDKP